MSNENKDIERFTILGEELPVRISDSDEVAKKALELVQDKITTIKEGSNNPPSNLQLALLSALNIAGEFIKLRRDNENQGLDDSTFERIRSLSQRLDSVLSEPDE